MNLELLKPGKLIKLNDCNLICWFSKGYTTSISRLKIGSKDSYRSESSDKNYDSFDLMIYLGLDSDYRNDDIIRQLRLVYIDGKVGYIECYDLSYFTILE